MRKRPIVTVEFADAAMRKLRDMRQAQDEMAALIYPLDEPLSAEFVDYQQQLEDFSDSREEMLRLMLDVLKKLIRIGSAEQYIAQMEAAEARKPIQDGLDLK